MEQCNEADWILWEEQVQVQPHLVTVPRRRGIGLAVAGVATAGFTLSVACEWAVVLTSAGPWLVIVPGFMGLVVGSFLLGTIKAWQVWCRILPT